MTGYKRDFNKAEASVTLLIAVEKTVSDVEKFIQIISSLKKRFRLKVSLVFKAPELLFFNRGMVNSVAMGEIDRIIVTNSSENFWIDYIEFAKRQESEELIMGELESILINWTELLKFKVSLQNAIFSIVEHKGVPFLAIKQTKLRELSSENAQTIGDVFAHLLSDQYLLRPDVKFEHKASSSLFVTKEGVGRFGGIDAFIKSDLIIGGSFPKDYNRIWQIDNKMSLEEFLMQDINALRNATLITIPGILSKRNNNQIIIDINPGFTPGESKKSLALNIPRTLLSISNLMHNGIKVVPSDIEAIFIMSNYNKAPYLAGALYSVAMQTHEKCSVHIIDDVSTDISIDIIKVFKSLVDSRKFNLAYDCNDKSKGTYWIRNSIINRYLDSDCFYFVNDSDDVSSCQRAAMQISIIGVDDKAEICFGDIVRVDKDFRLLPLDGKVERYGTASLGGPTAVHRKYGFYENIRKNSDTEFIERLRHFSGKDSTKWFRYPALFQPFDGENLTADIYKKSEGGNLVQALNKRQRHVELFKKKHSSLSLDELFHVYGCFNFEFDEDYRVELAEFLVIQN